MGKLFDFSVFSDVKESIELGGNAVRKALEFDAYTNKTKFVAVALTDAVPLSVGSANLFFPTTGSAATQAPKKDDLAKFVLKARILGEKGRPSPHSPIPDPCDITYATNPELSLQLISMHTTFISTDDIMSTDIPKQGDLIVVQLEGSPNTKYNLQFGYYIGLKESQVAGVSNQAAFNINCSALDFDGLPGGMGVGGLNPRCKTAAHVQPDPLGGLTINSLFDKCVGRPSLSHTPTGIVMHYTVTGGGRNNPAAGVSNAAAVLGKRHPDPLSYHYIIGTDGSIHQMIEVGKLASHAHGGNSGNIGIALVNLGNDFKNADRYSHTDPGNWVTRNNSKWEPYTPQQLNAVTKLVRELKKSYPTIQKVQGHEDLGTGKGDPGPLFDSTMLVLEALVAVMP